MGHDKNSFRRLSPKSGFRHYLLGALIIIVTSAICFFLTGYIGYQSVSLILLFVVSILSVFLGIGPIALAATLSAFIWNFFFIPPRFTINIDKTEDVMMLCMFFIIALVNGILTSRIRQQEKLAIEKERKARFLDESDKLYKTLFNSISHELRIPVATIMSASESLLTLKHSEPIKEELLNEILKASDRLNRLIENLLNMSRLESGHITPRLDWYDINDLVNKVITGLREQLKPFDLKVAVADDMPLVKIDFGLMEQVLYNLVLNATLYAGPSSALGINVFYTEGVMTIEVLDRGPGFQPEELPLIFNKFYRVEGSKAGGTGLGLSIARGFTEAHKGTISAENRPEGGAKFIVRIPSEMPHVELNQTAEIK